MAAQELTRDEVFALAGAFPVGSTKTLAGIAREAVQLTAQYPAGCDPVIASPIVRHGGG